MVNQTHHRSEEQIVADILASILNGTRKTRIMYGANLSYALTTKYLRRLLDCGLIQYDDEQKHYLLTNTGRHYLEEYSEYKTIEGKLLAHTSRFEEKRGILIQMLSNSDLRG